MRTLLLASGLIASAASAEPLLYEKAGLYETGLVVGLSAGADFSSPFNELGTSPALGLELGWLLPALDRSLQLLVAGQWAAPTGSGDVAADPRLPGDGVAHYDVDQQTLRLTLGLRYRLPLDGAIRPYAMLGGRAWLLETTMKGDADGQAFGTYVEKSTEYGVVGALGGEWHTDYGALALEVEGGYAGYDRTLYEASAVGTLAVQLAWRFFL